jgi:glycosyltransferase involved in cell wall biosynthesis
MEAHSIGFLEALASGIPVVASRIAAFEFARDYPGVSLVDTKNPSAYAQALLDALNAPRAWRSLDGYTLHDTAESYLKIAQAVFEACGISKDASLPRWKGHESI